MLGAVAHQRLTGRVVRGDAGGELDEGLDLLHPVGVGDADNAAHLHHLVRVEDVLDLTGVDVVAGRDDHALGAAAEVNEALRVHRAEVTGVDPSEAVGVTAQGLRGLVGMLHVLLHHGGAGEQDLALGAVGDLLIGARLNDLDVGVRERHADRALLEHMRRRQAAGRDRLGGAIALAHLHRRAVGVEELIQLLLQLDRQAVSAGEHALERAEVRALHARQTQQRLVERGHARDEVAVILGDELCIALGGKARHEDAAPALREHGVDAHAEAEAVEERHGGEHLVAGVEHWVRRDDLLAECIEVPVRQHDALGRAGRAAGVEDDGGVVAGALDGVIPEAGLAHVHEFLPANDRRVLRDLGDLAALGEHIARADGLAQLILDARDDDVDDLCVLADALELVVELVERDGGDALRLVKIELDLLLRREGMDHVRDAADEVDSVEHIDGLRAVGHSDGDLVARAHADGLEGAGALLDLLDHLGIGGGLAHEVERDVPWVPLGDQLERLKHRAVKVVQMQRHVAGVTRPRGLGSDLSHNRPPVQMAARAARGARAGA